MLAGVLLARHPRAVGRRLIQPAKREGASACVSRHMLRMLRMCAREDTRTPGHQDVREDEVLSLSFSNPSKESHTRSHLAPAERIRNRAYLTSSRLGLTLKADV